MTQTLDERGRIFVIFRLGSEEYGLDIGRVQNIVRYEEPTKVPHCPQSIMGVINMRGRIIPVIDMARRLGRSAFAPTAGSRIIVVEGAAGLLGLAVDAANEVVGIARDAIQPTPEAAISPEVSEMFEGVAQRDGALVILVDLDRTVPKGEYARLSENVRPEGGRDV